MRQLFQGRLLLAVAVTVLICGAATAGAASLITSADVKNDSLKGEDIKNGTLESKDVENGTLQAEDLKDGSIGKKKLNPDLVAGIPVRITGDLPTGGFSATNGTVVNTSDGIAFGPYANGGAAGGSVCTDALNGQTFGDVEHLAYEARYTATNDTGGVGVPYLRVFLVNDHDAIFSPNTQAPDPDIAEGPFHTWVATAGSWRYDDDAGNGPDSPFSVIQGAHATEEITSLCISVGFTAGTNLSGLLRTWEVNDTDYAFGL